MQEKKRNCITNFAHYFDNELNRIILFIFSFLLGMTAELHKHWEAEDDLLNMQNVLDETDLKLYDAKLEIQRLNKNISDESQNDKRLEEQFEAISGNI